MNKALRIRNIFLERDINRCTNANQGLEKSQQAVGARGNFEECDNYNLPVTATQATYML